MAKNESSGVGMALNRAFKVGPTAALIVPEEDLLALAWTAREIVFGDHAKAVRIDLMDDLDRTSEAFADMLDLPLSEMTDRRKGLVANARAVLAWIDAGCITLPPVHHIRPLLEALL